LRDALYRLDDADLAELVTRMELSHGMLRWLSFDADRIWTADPPPPVPKPAEEKNGLWCTP
jgi:hypothetical protein